MPSRIFAIAAGPDKVRRHHRHPDLLLCSAATDRRALRWGRSSSSFRRVTEPRNAAMPRLSETIGRLRSLGAAAAPAADRLSDLGPFGPNPGSLGARTYVPPALAPGSALVVVLHGCTQSAAVYDHGSGWSTLAERHGFALLFPEQSSANNAAGCFNWFVPDDVRRGSGEAMSIHGMIRTMIDAHDLDPARVFVTGLSAGAASSMAMLAAYPELFAGGAIIAGLPYGCAGSVREAFDRMRGHGLPPARELAARARAASPHRGPWPTLSVWHGTADHTVSPANADAIVAQWCGLLGLAAAPDVVETGGRHERRAWRDAAGREAVEAWRISGLGHGTPIDAGPGGVGASAPFMLDVGISSTQHIAHRWGLAPAPAEVADGRAAAATRAAPAPAEWAAFTGPASPLPQPAPATSRVGQVIEDALRAAGLMR
jgi:poly(hydroxyalkanoate) depolymerase family esterase